MNALFKGTEDLFDTFDMKTDGKITNSDIPHDGRQDTSNI